MAPAPRVSDWMTTPVTTIHADALVKGAADLMRSRRLRHLPVVDGDGRLVGIVTDRDLRHVIFSPLVRERLASARDLLKSVRVSEIMTRGVVTVRRDMSLADAAGLMHERRIGAVPVVEHARVVGILTEDDVQEAFRAIVRRPEGPLRRRRPRRPRARYQRRYDFGFPLPPSGDPWRDEGGGS